MAKTEIEQIVERVVTQVLEDQVPRLRAELVTRVLAEVGPQLKAAAEGAPGQGGNIAELVKAASGIQAGTTQKEILRALLDGTSSYCGRAALFVMKGRTATGWQGRGFADEVKDFGLNVTEGIAAQALETRTALAGASTDLDSNFASRFGAPADNRVMVLPLLLKDKVAALVYADAGTQGGPFDASALELLVIATSAWLEVASLRKQSSREEAPGMKAEAAPVQTVSSFSDPFAGHAPSHVAPPPPMPEQAAAAAAGVATAEATVPVAGDQMSAEDADLHRKAQRFARLLVDEIKLYNQVKVSEGRKNRDLYDRLKEDIEKSRSTYQKRYGNTVASSADYFNQEVVRSLAEDDSSLMGANFRK